MCSFLLYSKVIQLYIYIYTHSFSYSFPLWFITGYWIYFPTVFYSRTLLFMRSICNSLHLLTPDSHSISRPARQPQVCSLCLLSHRFLHMLFPLLKECFLNFNVHRNHLSILLKCPVWLSESGARPEILDFSHAGAAGLRRSMGLELPAGPSWFLDTWIL